MRNRLLAAVLAAGLALALAPPALGGPLHYPARPDDGFTHRGVPAVSAASWLLYDETLDRVLASFSPDDQRAMASTTKIMTGLLTLENAGMDEVVTVSRTAAEAGEKEIDLVVGEQVTVDALFKALMIHSANDAAVAIAEHISGSVDEFVALMNRRAEELGLEGTRFANPHGLDAPDHYSTARDLLELAREAMSHPKFQEAVRARALVFPPAPDGTLRRGESTNLLLGDYEGSTGVKTGFTDQAQLTFVSSAEREGRRLYVVLLGSEGTRAHFSDARLLLDYGFRSLGIYTAVIQGGRYEPMTVRVEPGPLVATARAEALVFLASQGLLSGEPPADDPVAPPAEPASTVVIRKTGQSIGPAEALRYWIDLLSGRA